MPRRFANGGWSLATLSAAFSEGTRFWAGKRFYRRQDVHINDFYYWGQGGRTGAGFEDMNVGLGQAAVAYFLYSNRLRSPARDRGVRPLAKPHYRSLNGYSNTSSGGRRPGRVISRAGPGKHPSVRGLPT